MCIYSNVSSEETKNFIENVRKDVLATYNKGIAKYLNDSEKREFFEKFKVYSGMTFDCNQYVDMCNKTPSKEQGVLDQLISSYELEKLIEKNGLDGNNWNDVRKEASRIKREFTVEFNKFYAKYYKSVAMFLEYIDEIFEPLINEPYMFCEKFKIHFPNGIFAIRTDRFGEKIKTCYTRIARGRIRTLIQDIVQEKNFNNVSEDEKNEKYILNEVAKKLKGYKDFPYAWIIEGRYLTITSDDEIGNLETPKTHEVEISKTKKVETEPNKSENGNFEYKIEFEGNVKEGTKDVTSEVQTFVSKCANDIIKKENLEDILIEGRIEDEKIEKYLLNDVLKKTKEKFQNRDLNWSRDWNLKGSYCTLKNYDKTRYFVTTKPFIPGVRALAS